MVLLIIFLTFMLAIFSINIKFEIENLKITIPKIKKKYANNDSKVTLKIYVFKKIKIAEINLKKVDFKNEKVRNKIQTQFKENPLNFDTVKFLKNLNYIFEKLDLKIYIGTEDAAITAIGVGLSYIIISNFLKGKIKGYKNTDYNIFPIYQNKNILKIEIDSIIIFKMESIINIIKFMKKGKVNKDVRTSNRRTYAYSNE